MFTNGRYITCGVKAGISLALQEILWRLVDSLNVEVDYLQVFTLNQTKNGKTGTSVQMILHEQECPTYSKEYEVDLILAVTAKIFVIDDGSVSTMLLAEEY